MPEWKDEIRQRLAGLRLEPAREAEVVEELSQHLEDHYHELLRGGATPTEAACQTRAELKESELLARELRRVERRVAPEPIVLGTNRRTTMIGDLWQDVRYGARMLVKNPGFTLMAVLTLALGIGANTAMFSLVHAVLLRPLPFPESDNLVIVKVENSKTGEAFPAASPADFFDWQRQSQSLAGFAASSSWPLTLLEGDQPEEVPTARVTAEFFDTLHVQPLLGRTFRPDEFKTGGDVVMLSHRLWQRRFGGDPGVVGKRLMAERFLAGVEPGRLTVIGVMPPAFKFPASAEAWTPVWQDSGESRLRASRYFQTIARLKPNVTLAQAEAEVRTIAARLASQYPEDAHWSVRLAPLRETLVGDVRLALLVLFGAVGLVLLIACGNVANLLLARATARQKELAIRASLGASRWRIIRQLIAESVWLSGVGGALGVLLARWSVSAMVWLVPKDLHVPRLEEAHVDSVVLGFTFAVALLASVFLGLVPGWKASRPDLQTSLQESGRSATTDRRWQRLRGALVVVEIALTLVLLAGAGLLIKSFLKLQRVELGFDPQQLLVVPVSASMAKYAQPPLRAAYFERLAGQVQTVPGVRSVATASSPPLMYTLYWPFMIDGKTDPNEVPQAWFSAVSPNYFRLMGIRVLAGREFTDHDRAGSPNVAVINETMHRRSFAGEDPVGRRLILNYLGTRLTLDVAGVVSDIKQESPGTPVNAQIYLSYLQVPWFSTALIIRAEADPSALVAAVQRALRSIDPTQLGSGAKTMEQVLADSVAPPRFYSLLLGLFAALALVLAAVGIYGVMSYTVAQRTHEIGIRLALGAQVRDVLRLVIGQGMRLVLMGAVIGLGAALALARVIRGLLYETGATDPGTFIGVTALLALVALLACYLPARRATKVDPMVALRHE